MDTPVLNSDNGHLLDTLLLLFYQTIILTALIAMGFVVYLIRARSSPTDTKLDTRFTSKFGIGIRNGPIKPVRFEISPPTQIKPQIEEENEVPTKQYFIHRIMKMIQMDFSNGTQIGISPNFDENSSRSKYDTDEESENSNGVQNYRPDQDNEMKLVARKRISKVVQKMQILDMIEECEIDRAIQSIRMQSQRLKLDGFYHLGRVGVDEI